MIVFAFDHLFLILIHFSKYFCCLKSNLSLYCWVAEQPGKWTLKWKQVCQEFAKCLMNLGCFGSLDRGVVAWKFSCLLVLYCSVYDDPSTSFLKCSASVTSFILMAWNSKKSLNTRRGCLPQEVWICNCWRQGGKAGDCSSTLLNLVLSPGYLPLVMLEAGPWAESILCRTELYKGEISYLGKEVIVICTCWGESGRQGNLPPRAQAHHAGKPWGHSLWQHPWLCDPLLWGGKPLLLMFNHFVLTWSAWCVPSRELWAHCVPWPTRWPWPSKVLILLQVTETGCLGWKVSCTSWISSSLPKPTCLFCKTCSWKWVNKPVQGIWKNAFV